MADEKTYDEWGDQAALTGLEEVQFTTDRVTTGPSSLPPGYVTYPESDVKSISDKGILDAVNSQVQVPTSPPTPATPVSYNPGTGPADLGADPAVKAGLGAANELLKAGLAKDYLYPQDISGQMVGPGEYNFTRFQQNPEMLRSAIAQWTDPNFQAQFQQGPGDVQAVGHNLTNIVGPERLQGGDYSALEQSLRVPGEIAAGEAFEKGMVNLKDVMGGRGIYGSSIMGNQMNELNKQYMNTLATNAAQATQQRYQMQQKDIENVNKYEISKAGMNIGQQQFLTEYEQAIATGNTARAQQMALEASKFGLAQDELNLASIKAKSAAQLQASELGMEQERDIYSAGLQDADRRQQYGDSALRFQMMQDDRLREFYNQQLKDQFNYQLSQQAWENSINEMLMNQSLAIAGQGAPLASAALQAQAAQEAARREAKAMEDAAMYEAIGTGAGMIGSKGLDWLMNL